MVKSFGDVPEDIQRAGILVKQLQAKPVLTRADLTAIQQAKLKVAFWACGKENVTATRENLSYILGSDAVDIMTAYDQARKAAADKSAKGKADGQTGKP